ncbi:hypothetical protein GCM10023196_107170 [Actinoallomurus vinaceus]|uniref:DUF4352 domain-containing protein n=1 Tax=Actinoallomurus vinaceus TaxID=1080074 RepID=A0ABP8UWU0_9ACTN
MARRLVWATSVAVPVALLVGVWATGGLRAAPRPRIRRPATAVDLGAYAVTVTDAVLRRPAPGSVVSLTVTLRVKNKERRSVLLEDFTVNALSLESAGGPAVTAAMAQATSQGADVNMLPPRVPVTVALRYVLPRGAVPPPGFHARLALWRYDHREDFFYGHVEWVSRKPADPKSRQSAEFAVPLPLRREGL